VGLISAYAATEAGDLISHCCFGSYLRMGVGWEGGNGLELQLKEFRLDSW
jgi:hypothetical protein